jgi:hypothetical protein
VEAALALGDELAADTPAGPSGACLYGYDFAGNPTLTDASCTCSSAGKRPG